VQLCASISRVTVLVNVPLPTTLTHLRIENVRLGIHASAAGHSLGGAIWKIKKDTDDIVYAVNWNHKKER